MDRPFAKASDGLDGFLARTRNPGANERDFAIKVAVRDGRQVEYFWITDFVEEGGLFKGRLSNRPQFVRNVSAGQTVSFEKAQIADWMYFEGTAMRGNFTACAMLQSRSSAERADFEKAYGLRC